MATPDDTPRYAVPVGMMLVVIVFAGALDNPFLSWDDGVYIVGNPLVTDPGAQPWVDRLTTHRLSYPLPLPVALYGLLWSLTSSPVAFHGLSLLVHLANVWLLWRVLRSEVRRWRVAGWAALAFAVHPVVVEPVAWATGVKDLLVGTGVLLAILGLRRGGAWLVPGAVVAFASKPNAVLLGLGLAAGWLGTKQRFDRRRLGALVGASVAGLGLLAFTMANEPSELRASVDVPLSMARVLGALGLQVQHALVPAGLSHVYPVAAIRTHHLGLGAVAVVASAWAAYAWQRARDPRFAWLATAWAIYLPASNLHPLHRFTADSFVYVPVMAVVAIIAHGWARHADAILSAADRVAILVRVLPFAVVVGWGASSLRQVEVWSSTTELWRNAVDAHPGHGRLVFRYGEALRFDARYDEERDLYLANLDALRELEQVPGPLPLFLERAGDLDGADEWYARAFASDEEQSDILYYHYAEYAQRHPDRIRPEHAQALRHSRAVHERSELGAAREAK